MVSDEVCLYSLRVLSTIAWSASTTVAAISPDFTRRETMDITKQKPVSTQQQIISELLSVEQVWHSMASTHHI
jgi:hypothetical protein